MNKPIQKPPSKGSPTETWLKGQLKEHPPKVETGRLLTREEVVKRMGEYTIKEIEKETGKRIHDIPDDEFWHAKEALRRKANMDDLGDSAEYMSPRRLYQLLEERIRSWKKEE